MKRSNNIFSSRSPIGSVLHELSYYVHGSAERIARVVDESNSVTEDAPRIRMLLELIVHRLQLNERYGATIARALNDYIVSAA